VRHRTQQLHVLSNWPCLSGHFEEELLVEDRCENLRSEFSKIPRLRAQVEMILKGMSLA
jgi:hypothetical protein